ncbi:uncharacterized protein RAG0_13681 [Rhynchosporium agropyri]|uniref:Uncharacterized protein n=1 Tax=Rhynchosporium agropyri TaxID=914238 RepID=A0A1E1LDV7_9HELO|nr:uncharacterized protein RAG0_13681 [Rhynchosporium agropyri]
MYRSIKKEIYAAAAAPGRPFPIPVAVARVTDVLAECSALILNENLVDDIDPQLLCYRYEYMAWVMLFSSPKVFRVPGGNAFKGSWEGEKEQKVEDLKTEVGLVNDELVDAYLEAQLNDDVDMNILALRQEIIDANARKLKALVANLKAEQDNKILDGDPQTANTALEKATTDKQSLFGELQTAKVALEKAMVDKQELETRVVVLENSEAKLHKIKEKHRLNDLERQRGGKKINKLERAASHTKLMNRDGSDKHLQSADIADPPTSSLIPDSNKRQKVE